MTTAHALLSASAAHKWLHCTPAPRLEATLPESTSDYAEEGRLAHEIAELKVRKYCIEPMGPRFFNAKMKKLKESRYYKDDMEPNTETYKEHIASILHSYNSKPYVAVEKKVDYSAYAPEGFGTCDCIIIGGDTLHVIDYKNGQGVPVSVVQNPQMMLYALGAFLEYSFLYPINKICLHIVQPKLGEPATWETTLTELLAWGESIKPIAQKAFNGEGDFVPGDHCKFCRAKARCRARSDFNLGLEEYRQMKPPLISNEEVGNILQRAQNLAAWVKAIEEYALAECLAGNIIPGWKAVHGTSRRSFTDVDKAFEVLIAEGTPKTMLYKNEPLTLSEAEKLIGAKKFGELLAEYISKPPGKPTLALESDKREAIKRQSAIDDFKEENTNE